MWKESKTKTASKDDIERDHTLRGARNDDEGREQAKEINVLS
jgi:hypothetical protein